MSKKLLIETRMNSLSLCEGVQQKEVHPGCLGTLSGPCADYKNPTRNNNMYRRKLWENVFNNDLVKESLEDRILIGELDHPGDRLETKAVNAAIVMTDYEFNDNEGLLYGTFDVLDTPNGRILKSLLDYGCKIGVSSRGEGDVVQKEGVSYVDEDSFTLVGFDAVVLPAVKAAKPALQESLNHESLNESLSKEIQTATTKSELDLIRKVVEATNIPEADSLLESVNIKSKELEGTTGSSNLMEDLETATCQLIEVKEENKSLKESITTCKEKLRKSLRNNNKLQESDKNRMSENSKLYRQINDLSIQLTASENQNSFLSEGVKVSKEYISKLEEEVRSTRINNSELESKVSSLEESLERIQSRSKSKIDEVSKLEEELKNLSLVNEKLVEENKTLKESYDRDTNKLKSKVSKCSEDYNKLLKDYTSVKSKSLGVNPEQVMESIKNSSSSKDVDSLVESIADRNDRYRSVPSSSDPLFNVSTAKVRTEVKKSSDELNSQSFMEQAVKFL